MAIMVVVVVGRVVGRFVVCVVCVCVVVALAGEEKEETKVVVVLSVLKLLLAWTVVALCTEKQRKTPSACVALSLSLVVFAYC